MENPHRVMRRARATLVCSDGEAFGRVTVESMAQATPVIGSKSGGTAEIVDHGVDGLLFPPRDVASLADRIRTLILDEPLRLRLAEGATQKARSFRGAESAMSPVQEILTALVGEKNPSWPLGSLVDRALLGVTGFEPATVPLRERGKQFMRRLVRRDE
jgi:hypothetical protein